MAGQHRAERGVTAAADQPARRGAEVNIVVGHFLAARGRTWSGHPRGKGMDHDRWPVQSRCFGQLTASCGREPQPIDVGAALCVCHQAAIFRRKTRVLRDALGAAGILGEAPVTSTIALVDDDRNILTSVSMALEAEGFAVRCYADGTEALKGIAAQPVDIAVLDIKMPRMDGMELLEQLRRLSHIPVIFLTSKDDEVDELLGLRMGADDYIKKPFSQRLLIERIRA